MLIPNNFLIKEAITKVMAATPKLMNNISTNLFLKDKSLAMDM